MTLSVTIIDGATISETMNYIYFVFNENPHFLLFYVKIRVKTNIFYSKHFLLNANFSK